MEKIDKIFTNVKPINHSGNSGSGKNVLRIKDIIFLSMVSPASSNVVSATIPPMERTAISVLPPPMSTIMCPFGSNMGSPQPIAAAKGFSIKIAFFTFVVIDSIATF